MQSNRLVRSSRRGFTLTELLVVIAIIAVLASLVSVGVMRALDTARQTRIKLELDQMDTALKAYKDKYGEYPPCDMRISFGPSITPSHNLFNLPLRRHLTRIFPRYNFSATEANGRTKLQNDLALSGLDLSTHRPDQALVFWLQGFGPDPTNPITTINMDPSSPAFRQIVQISNGAATEIVVTRTPLFEFDKGRLVKLPDPNTTDLKQVASYVPAGVKNNAPYLYFESSMYMDTNRFPTSTPLVWNAQLIGLQAAGFAMPYFSDEDGNGEPNTPNTVPAGNETFVNPDSYQLIATGIDGKYGSTQNENPNIGNTFRCYPTGNLLLNPNASVPSTKLRAGYDKSGLDDDNVTNFCSKSRLGDARP